MKKIILSYLSFSTVFCFAGGCGSTSEKDYYDKFLQACSNNNVEQVKNTLEKLEEKSLPLSLLGQTEENSPLHRATQENPHVLEYLLNYQQFKFNPNTKTSEKKETPLHIACLFGYKKATQLLLEHNADVNALTENKSTPLHYLMSNHGTPEIAALLLEHGASCNLLDSYQQTPLSMAADKKQNHLIELFLTTPAHNKNHSILSPSMPTKLSPDNLIKLLTEQPVLFAANVTIYPLGQLVAAIKGLRTIKNTQIDRDNLEDQAKRILEKYLLDYANECIKTKCGYLENRPDLLILGNFQERKKLIEKQMKKLFEEN
ncbi:MAG: ankyrin repeat domain-containing protein [Candidatus Babeliales bacterium]